MNLAEINIGNCRLIFHFLEIMKPSLRTVGFSSCFLLSLIHLLSLHNTLHRIITNKKSHKCMFTGQPCGIRGQVCSTKRCSVGAR